MGVYFLALGIFGSAGMVNQFHEEVSKGVRSVAPVITVDSAKDVVSLLSEFKKFGKLPPQWSWSRVAKLLASPDPGLFCQQNEALEILKTLPKVQQGTYELSVEGEAKNAYAAAKEKDDPEAMLAVAMMYPIHRYGKDALNWLGSYFLNRGEFGSAHTFYRELTRGEEARKADEKIWVKAALAAHQAGDAKLRDTAFEVLKERKVKIRVGGETVDADGIKKEISGVVPGARKIAMERIQQALEKPYASKGFDSQHARWLAQHSFALLKDVAPQLSNHRKFLAAGDRGFCTVFSENEVSCLSPNRTFDKRVFRKPIKQLVSAGGYTCVLLSDGTVWDWETYEREPAEEIKEFSGAKELVAGGIGLCAVHGDSQKVSCKWAFNRGIYSSVSSLKQISAFDSHGCGIDTKSGEVRCWDYGTNVDGPSKILTPPKIKRGTQVAVGSDYACVLVDGKPVCWGDKDAVARVPAGLKDITSLSLGHGDGSGSCALTKQETVLCWGGRGGQPHSPPKGLEGVLRISMAKWLACADTRNQGVVCWGTPTSEVQLFSRSASDLLKAKQKNGFLHQIPACEKRK